MNVDSPAALTGSEARSVCMERLEPQQIAETLVALANSDGGSLLFGARAEGEPADARVTQEMLDDALAAAQELCDPPVLTGEQRLVALAEARAAWRLDVPRSLDVHSLEDGRVLVRSGEGNRPLGGREIQRLAGARAVGDYENEVVPGAGRSDFSEEMISAWLTRRSLRLRRPVDERDDALLQEIGALNADGQATVTGVLLFCERPQRWLPQSGIVFVRFAGVTPRGEDGLAGYSRREELAGPLPRMVEAAWNLVWSEMAVSAVVKDLEREETLEYPRFAVREAIVNAVCHRDYRMKGRRIEIRMYADRLEVVSPGGLPGFITIDTLIVGDWSGFVSGLHHLVLPAFVLAFSIVGLLARITRTSMLEVLGQEYIRTARAKGLSNNVVLYRHALKNALIPTITILGLAVGALLSGAVLTETIFAWPGMGRFLVQSILSLDRAAVVGVTLTVAIIYSMANLVVDVAIALIDPRVTYD